MNGNLTLSNKEYLILQLLINAPVELYGLQMVEASEGQLKKGTIYVTLGRMEDKGYIESRKDEFKPRERGLPKRLYRATGEGRRTFDLECQIRHLREVHAAEGVCAKTKGERQLSKQ